MTDGTTGFQVAPITEDEMSRVHDILTRAINAIVSMSQLSKDVESLRNQVAQLTDDSTRLRRTNDALEESLSNSRRNRQEMEAKLNDEIERSIQAQSERERATEKANALAADVEYLSKDLHAERREREDAQYKVMELQDALDKLRHTHDSIKSALGIVDPPKAVQEVTPSAPPSLGPMVQPSTEVGDHTVPLGTTTQPPGEPTRRYISDWQAGAMWDTDKQSYYIEEAHDLIPF